MTVGSILRGGFGLIRAQPGAVAIWGMLYLAAALLGLAFAMPTMTAMAASPTPDPAAMQSAMGLIWLYDLVLLAVVAVIFAAVFRAVIAPQQRGLAYLRLGMDEVRLVGLSILLCIAAFVAMFVATLVIVLGAVLIGALLGGQGAMVAIGVVLFVVLGCVAIWLEVRLSITFPLTFMRGRITIGEAWRLTAGRFWTLFGAYLVGVLIVTILSMVVFLPMFGGYLAAMIHASGHPQQMNAVMQAQLTRTLHPGIGMIVMWLLGGAVYAIGIALGGGMLATAAVTLIEEADAAAAAPFD